MMSKKSPDDAGLLAIRRRSRSIGSEVAQESPFGHVSKSPSYSRLAIEDHNILSDQMLVRKIRLLRTVAFRVR